MEISEKKISDHSVIKLYNAAGMVLTLSSLGAAIREVRIPDKNGETKTVTLCPVDEEANRYGYYGKTIGRTAGRIAGARFTIDGKVAFLEKNNRGVDNLHGGSEGFHAKVFGYSLKEEAEFTDAVFTYFSKVYENENKFVIYFGADSDEKILMNMTNHVYWNMGGDLSESVKDQILYINADRYGKLNERLIVEKVLPVTKHMDFRKPHAVGDYIEEDDVQQYTAGYDHPYFFKSAGCDKTACTLYSEKSGIKLEMRTTYPAVVLYTNNYPDERLEVFPGKKSSRYLALCLECQYHPDGVHQCPENCGILSPGKPYFEEVQYIFTVKQN